MEIKNILQHYPTSEKSFITSVMNILSDVENKYSVRSLGFLNPSQRIIFKELLAHFCDITYIEEGGHTDTERKKIIVFSSFFKPPDIDIIILKIKYNKKFNDLQHNQILGTLLNEGYKIEKIGDIIILDDPYLIIDTSIFDSIKYSLTHISKVKVSFEECNEIIGDRIELPTKNKYTKTLRIDAVIKVLTNESREKSRLYFTRKYVQYNYIVVEDTSITVQKNDIISVRGFGRITIINIIKSTKGYYIEYR